MYFHCMYKCVDLNEVCRDISAEKCNQVHGTLITAAHTSTGEQAATKAQSCCRQAHQDIVTVSNSYCGISQYAPFA